MGTQFDPKQTLERFQLELTDDGSPAPFIDWEEPQISREEAKEFQRFYTEPQYMAQRMGPSSEAFPAHGVSLSALSGGVRASRDRAYLGRLAGFLPEEVDDQTYVFLKDGYMRAFGGEAGMMKVSDDAISALIEKQMQQTARLDAARADLSGTIMQRLLQSGPTAEFPEDAARDFARRHGGAYDKAEDGEREYLNAYDQLRNALGPNLPLAASALDMLMGQTGVKGKTRMEGRQERNIWVSLAKLPQDQRQAIFAGLRAVGAAMSEGDAKGFWKKTMESVGRGAGDYFLNVTGARTEQDLLQMRDMVARHSRRILRNGMPAGLNAPLMGVTPFGPSPVHVEVENLSPERRDEVLAEIDEALEISQVMRELRDIADKDVDPIRPSNGGVLGMVEGGFYGFARSTPMMAMGFIPGGQALVAQGIYADEYNRLRLEYKDLDRNAASEMAMLSATLQMPMEMIQIKGLMGRMPGVSRLIRRLGEARLPIAVRGGMTLVGNTFEQATQEISQNAVSFSVEALGAALREDMPEFDFERNFRGFLEEAPAMIFSVLPMALIGTGAASFRDLRNGAAQTRDLTYLQIVGFSRSVADRIAAESDPAKRDSLVREHWDGRTDEDIANGRKLASQLPDLKSFEWVEENAGRDIELRGTGERGLVIGQGAAFEADGTARRNESDGETNGTAPMPEIRFSKGAVKPEQLGKAAFELAKDDSVFRLGPTPEAKDLPTILKTLAPQLGQDIAVSDGAGWHGEGYTFTDSKGGEIFLTTHPEGGYRVDSARAGTEGTLVYQAIYAWAHNNDVQVHGDLGMTDLGTYRRNAQMISSILRFGTSKHLTVGPASGLADSWIRNDSSRAAAEYNLGLLLQREKELVFQRLPELAKMRYDSKENSFYDGEHRIPSEEVETYFEGRIAQLDTGISARVGHSTARRALAVAAAEKGEPWGYSGMVGDTAEALRPFEGIFYSKDAGGAGSPVGGDALGAGGESARVSGEAGRGESGRGLGSVEHAAQVRGWTGEIRAGWGSKLDVVVHDSAEGIANARLRDAVLKEGGGVEAFFDPADGRVHLLADRVGRKADAERLMRHEGIHWAVNGKLKREYDSILEGVRKRISDDEWKALKKSYSDAGDQVLVEEYLAYLGQNNPKAGAWRSFVYEFKQAMKRFFGRDFDITDEDVLAFLAKANRELEKGDQPGVRVYSEADLLFAKGSERKSWEEVKIGDDFNAVKKHLPYNSEKPVMLDLRGEPAEIYGRVAEMLRQRPSVIDPDGKKILVGNPDGRADNELLIRAEHLTASKTDRYKRADRSFRDDKARWLPNIWKTVEDYGAMVRHFNDSAYVRKYGDGTVHVVFVEGQKIVGYEAYDSAVVSQRALEAHKSLKGATIVRKKPPGAFPIQGEP